MVATDVVATDVGAAATDVGAAIVVVTCRPSSAADVGSVSTTVSSRK